MADEEQAKKEAPFLKGLIKLGVNIDPATSEEAKKALSPLQKYMTEFSKSTDMKNTFFGKLPGIKQMFQNLKPDTVNFIQQMAVLGDASRRGGVDNGEFYNSLGMMGKFLSNTVGFMKNVETESMSMSTALDVASFGILALVQLGILLAQGIKNVTMAAIEWQDELNEFSKLMGGIAADRILAFNSAINANLNALGQYGFALGASKESFTAYIKNGLAPAIALSTDLTKATIQLSTVTGQSVSEIAGFWAGIQRGSRLGTADLESFGNAWTSFNASVEKSGKIGVVSFSLFKEAITSVGTALLIAADKGHEATQRMTSDLLGLSGLANALNISVSDLNGKFEESSNLLLSQESGFRALLAISGGANIDNMLSNQFNKTEAMLKVADKLSQLREQFGGNLNIMAQVAEQSFGISKEVAIKFATMSNEQKKALQDARRDATTFKGLDDAYKNVSSTLTTAWEKFKNILFRMFQTSLVGNDGIQGILSKIGQTLTRFSEDLGNPNSGLSKAVAAIGDMVTRFMENISGWLDDLIPLIERFVTWIDSIFDDLSKSTGFFDAVKTGLIDVITGIVSGVLWALTSKVASFAGRVSLGIATLGASELFRMQLEQLESQREEGKKEISLINDSFKGKLDEIKASLKQNTQEEDRYKSFKDTDIVVGKDGQFSLAGIEKNKLEDERNALLKKQIELQEQIKTNTQNTADAIKGNPANQNGTTPPQDGSGGNRPGVGITPIILDENGALP